jgi:hypothetical protein
MTSRTLESRGGRFFSLMVANRGGSARVSSGGSVRSSVQTPRTGIPRAKLLAPVVDLTNQDDENKTDVMTKRGWRGKMLCGTARLTIQMLFS